MSSPEYRAQMLAHNTEARRLLDAASPAVREFLERRFRMDLYPLNWLQEMLSDLEALHASAEVRAASSVPAILREEMRAYLDRQIITGETIGDVRRALFVPWASAWNGWVRDDTAAREKKEPS